MSEQGVGSPYEVRCPRCNVTFPVETRTCIHCGGPTGASGAHSIRNLAQSAIGIEESVPNLPRTGPAPVDVEGDDGPPSIIRSILNSMGSLVWIVLLVVFSLARNCAE